MADVVVDLGLERADLLFNLSLMLFALRSPPSNILVALASESLVLHAGGVLDDLSDLLGGLHDEFVSFFKVILVLLVSINTTSVKCTGGADEGGRLALIFAADLLHDLVGVHRALYAQSRHH